MVEFKCDKGNVLMTLDGNIAELYADISTLVHVAYRRLYHKDVLSAMAFRSAFESSVSEMFALTNEEVKANE